MFPSPKGRSSSIWTWLAEQRPELQGVGDPQAPAIAHRLDRATSGIMLVARTDEVYASLREGFDKRRIQKAYLTLVEGSVEQPFDLDLPLGTRYRRSQKVMVALPGRKLRGVRPAHTYLRPLGRSAGHTLCLVRISTGVRHQIRAHLAHAGHPVAGDQLYRASGNVPGLEDRVFLHAWRIRLGPPLVPTLQDHSCPLSADLQEILGRMELSISLLADLDPW